MAANRADFTLTFRRLCAAAAGPEGDEGVRALFADPAAYDAWALAWRGRLKQETISEQERAAAMRMANPAFIPRNHRVEAALSAAVEPAGLPALRGITGRPLPSLRRQARAGAVRHAGPPRPMRPADLLWHLNVRFSSLPALLHRSRRRVQCRFRSERCCATGSRPGGPTANVSPARKVWETVEG